MCGIAGESAYSSPMIQTQDKAEDQVNRSCSKMFLDITLIGIEAALN